MEGAKRPRPGISRSSENFVAKPGAIQASRLAHGSVHRNTKTHYQTDNQISCKVSSGITTAPGVLCV